MPNIQSQDMRKGALRPSLRVLVDADSEIDFGAAGVTNVVYIRNETTGAWIRQGTGAGVTGGKNYLQLDWQAGDTDQVAPIAIAFKSTDSSGNDSYYPPDGVIEKNIVEVHVAPSVREVTP